MHFSFAQSGPGSDGVDGEGVDGVAGDAESDGAAPVGAPLGVEVVAEGDGDPPPPEAPEPLGGSPTMLPQAVSTSAATAPAAATELNRRRLTTPERYGTHRPIPLI
jgi:hypothetical protein